MNTYCSITQLNLSMIRFNIIHLCHRLTRSCEIYTCIFTDCISHCLHTNCFYEKYKSIFVSVVTETKSFKEVSDRRECCYNFFLIFQKDIRTLCNMPNTTTKIEVITKYSIFLRKSKTAIISINITTI